MTAFPGSEKEASYLAPNIQLVCSKSNKTDTTSLRNLSGKPIKKTEGKGNKNLKFYTVWF